MPASKVRRVRSEGFSKNITICLPARMPRKAAGRCLSMDVRLKSDRISAGETSWMDTRSRGATGSVMRLGGSVFGLAADEVVARVSSIRSIRAMGSVFICISQHSLNCSQLSVLSKTWHTSYLLRQLSDTPRQRLRFFRIGGDDQHGVVAGDGADHFGPVRGVEGGGDGLGASNCRLDH